MAVLSSTRIEGLAFQIETATHKVISDVSAALGGKDTAPNPHEYLEISLAACTAITLQMYAARKKIPLESVDVKIKITAEGPANEMQREVHLVGPLSEEDKALLMTIAEKCPIHKFLSAGAKISTVAV